MKIGANHFRKLRRIICGLWCCEIADDKKCALREQLVEKVKKEIENGRKSFALPFLGFGNTLAAEVALELREKHYLSLIGILPCDGFIDAQTGDGGFWKKAYSSMDWCFTAGEQPCAGREETFARCAKGLLEISGRMIVGYTDMPNQQTLDLILNAQADFFCRASLINL